MGFKSVEREFRNKQLRRELNGQRVNLKHIQLIMIGRMFSSQTRFTLDGVMKDNYISNDGLALEMSHNTFNIRGNLVIETESDFIVGHMWDGIESPR